MLQSPLYSSRTRNYYFGAVFLVSCIACTNDSATVSRTNTDYKTEQFSSEELQQDLDTLMLYLSELHPDLYHKSNKSKWETTERAIAADLNTSLNRAAFFQRLLPLFQLEQDGHTFVNYPMTYSDTLNKQGALFFPFKVKFWNQNIYLIENYSNMEIPEYAELISINNISSN